MAAMMAMAPALIGATGGVMNMFNGSPASRVQPGMNPLQFAGQTFQPSMNMGLGAVSNAPNTYANSLPQFGSAVNDYFTNNPGIGTMISGANTAAGMGTGVAGNLSGLGDFLARMGQGLTPWAGDMLQQGSVQNPGTGGLIQNAQNVAGLGANAVGNMWDTGKSMVGAGQSLFPAVGSILNAGFDPQQALYERTQHQLQEQTRASEAARGLGNSPFGAGLENKAMSDFNIDWQNNLLSRMATGASGANSLLGPAGNLLTGGIGMMAQAPGMLSQTGSAPYQAGATALSDILRNKSTGAQGAGLLLDQSGRDVTGGASLMSQAPGLASSTSMLPYQAFNTIGGNVLGALNQYGQFWGSGHAAAPAAVAGLLPDARAW
jgi:hypothetical protein